MVKKFNDLQKQKYGQYHKELKDCEVKHCRHESNTMKKSLKNKSKTKSKFLPTSSEIGGFDLNLTNRVLSWAYSGSNSIFLAIEKFFLLYGLCAT